MTDQIDYQLALRCAHLSNEVYRTFNDELRFSMRPSLVPKLFDIKRTDTQVALLQDPETQCGYVIFRGYRCCTRRKTTGLSRRLWHL